MLRKRLAIPLAVAVAGTSVVVAGILRADATEAPAGCGVSYGVVAQWNPGFTANLRLRNAGSAPIAGWALGFALPADQRVEGGWSGHWSQSGATVTVRDTGWNRTIARGGAVSIGFNGSWRGSNPPPTAFTLNGMACD